MKAATLTESFALSQSEPERVIRKHRTRLFAFIKSRVANAEDAEDLVQDVFYQFLTSFNTVEPIESAAAWLLTVARNKIIDWYRKRKTLPVGELLRSEDEQAESIIEALYDPDSNPEILLERLEFWREFGIALEKLPQEQRRVFIKHEIEGYSYKEISDETGISASLLTSRKHDAVVRLRTLLAESNQNY